MRLGHPRWVGPGDGGLAARASGIGSLITSGVRTYLLRGDTRRRANVDETEYGIRPFEDADFEAEARITREFDPEHAATVEELRHWDSVMNLQKDHLNLRLAVERRSSKEVVGFGSLAQPHWNYHPRKYWLWVAVAPSYRRQGIGTTLYLRLEQEARSRGGLGLWMGTREADSAGMAFLKARGVRILNRIWMSRVDLRRNDFTAVPDRTARIAELGITISTMAESGFTSAEVRKQLYNVVQTAAIDVPRVGKFQAATFEEFLAVDVDAPGIVPDGVFLAWKGGELVGMSSLERDLGRPDTIKVGFTGVLPAWRGRGLATELKRRAALLAREKGFHFLVTGNDTLNAPILRINRQFGFEPETVYVQGEKSLAD